MTTTDELRAARIHDHLALVSQIVHQLASRYPRHVERDELWNAGALGLVEAAHRYDPALEIPFPRFAAIRIRGAVIDATRCRDWATRGVRRRARAVDAAAADLQRAHGRPPSDDEIAVAMATTVADVHARRAAAWDATVLHLDARPSGGEDDPLPLASRVAEGDVAALPLPAVERREVLSALRTAVAHLPEPQREVISRYYFGGDRLRDIAATLAVTEARASQIRAEALNAVRAWFATQDDDVAAVPEAAPGRRARSAYVTAMTERLAAARAGRAGRPIAV